MTGRVKARFLQHFSLTEFLSAKLHLSFKLAGVIPDKSFCCRPYWHRLSRTSHFSLAESCWDKPVSWNSKLIWHLVQAADHHLSIP